MASDHKALIAEARDVAKWFRGERSVVVNVHDARFETLLDRLADALSAQPAPQPSADREWTRGQREKLTPEAEAKRDMAEIAERHTPALRSAISSQTSPREGGEWVLVPREPTEAMLKAYRGAINKHIDNHVSREERTLRGGHTGFKLSADLKATVRYRAMISAASSPLVGEG